MDQITKIFLTNAIGPQEAYRQLRYANLFYINDTVSFRKTRITYASTLGTWLPGLDYQNAYIASKLAALGLIYANMNEDTYLEFVMGSPTAVTNTEYVKNAVKAEADETHCPQAEDIGVSSNAGLLGITVNDPQVVAQCYLQSMQTVYNAVPRRFICSHPTGTTPGFPGSDRSGATGISTDSLDFMNDPKVWVDDKLCGKYFCPRPTSIRNARTWCPEQ
jgi:hypothetical protein